MLKTPINDTNINKKTNEIIIKKKINQSKNIFDIDKEIDLMTNETESINLNKEEKHKENKSKINKLPKKLFIDITQKYKHMG